MNELTHIEKHGLALYVACEQGLQKVNAMRPDGEPLRTEVPIYLIVQALSDKGHTAETFAMVMNYCEVSGLFKAKHLNDPKKAVIELVARSELQPTLAEKLDLMTMTLLAGETAH